MDLQQLKDGMNVRAVQHSHTINYQPVPERIWEYGTIIQQGDEWWFIGLPQSVGGDGCHLLIADNNMWYKAGGWDENSFIELSSEEFAVWQQKWRVITKTKEYIEHVKHLDKELNEFKQN